MIFNDVLKFYEELDDIVLQLDPIIKTVSVVKREMTLSFISTSHKLMNYINNDAQRKLTDLSELIKKSRKIINGYTDMHLKNIDLYSLGKLHNKTLKLSSDSKVLNEEIISLSNKVDVFSNNMHSITCEDMDASFLSIDSLMRIYNTLDDFELALLLLKDKIKFVKKLEISLNDVDFEYKEENILQLRFYGHHYSLESLNDNLSIINNIYNKLFIIIKNEDNVSPTEHLAPIKVETGTLFAKLAGDPFIIKAIEIIFETVFVYYISNLLSKGSKSNDKKEKKADSINALREILDLKSSLLDAGYTVSGDEDTIKSVYDQVLNDALSVVEVNPRLEINSKVLDLKEQTVDNLLLNQTLLINDNINKINSSESQDTDAGKE